MLPCSSHLNTLSNQELLIDVRNVFPIGTDTDSDPQADPRAILEGIHIPADGVVRLGNVDTESIHIGRVLGCTPGQRLYKARVGELDEHVIYAMHQHNQETLTGMLLHLNITPPPHGSLSYRSSDRNMRTFARGLRTTQERGRTHDALVAVEVGAVITVHPGQGHRPYYLIASPIPRFTDERPPK